MGGQALHAQHSPLRLTAEGFTFSKNFRRRFVPWHVVQSFRMFAAGLLGFDGYLPSTYGVPAEELCELLNRIRDRYGAPTPELWGASKSE
jgi:hypothetical protein